MLFLKEMDKDTEEKVMSLLKEQGYDVQNVSPFRAFAEEEARYRILDMDVLSEEEVAKLDKNDVEILVNYVADEYLNKDVLDYDFMNYILRTEYNKYLNVM